MTRTPRGLAESVDGNLAAAIQVAEYSDRREVSIDELSIVAETKFPPGR